MHFSMIRKSLLVPSCYLFMTVFLLAPIVVQASSPKKRTLCVFDVVGKRGDVFNLMEDYRPAALKWGVKFELKPYTDEKIAAEDFKSGQCDAVVLTGVRARKFNAFSGTINAVGALPTYEHLKMTLKTLAQPNASKYMKTSHGDVDYEVAGIVPAGSVYMFVRNRNVDTVKELSGKRIGVLMYDKASKLMVNQVGASLVGSSLSNIGGKFNNDSVAAIPMPLAAYHALELYKGLNPNGAIIDFVISQLTHQVLIRRDAFPKSFGQKSREYIYGKVYGKAMNLIQNSREGIKQKYWKNLPKKKKKNYRHMFQKSRMKMKNKRIYDAKMLKLLHQVRCRINPSKAECT